MWPTDYQQKLLPNNSVLTLDFQLQRAHPEPKKCTKLYILNAWKDTICKTKSFQIENCFSSFVINVHLSDAEKDGRCWQWISDPTLIIVARFFFITDFHLVKQTQHDEFNQIIHQDNDLLIISHFSMFSKLQSDSILVIWRLRDFSTVCCDWNPRCKKQKMIQGSWKGVECAGVPWCSLTTKGKFKDAFWKDAHHWEYETLA